MHLNLHDPKPPTAKPICHVGPMNCCHSCCAISDACFVLFGPDVAQKYTNEEASLKLLHDGQERTVAVHLQAPVRLIPFHIKGKPPTYFIVAGLVFTPVTVPYLRSEYGKEYDFDAPVKLLDKMMHAMAERPDQQVIVLSQVLASEVNIGYEEILNTQV